MRVQVIVLRIWHEYKCAAAAAAVGIGEQKVSKAYRKIIEEINNRTLNKNKIK